MDAKFARISKEVAAFQTGFPMLPGKYTLKIIPQADVWEERL